MAQQHAEATGELPAGSFSSWLSGMRSALRGERAAPVPCGSCTACCTSSQFVHIEPEETETLSRIPPELRFPAPGRPAGHVVLGYDERGHCPMFEDGACSIYEHRPRTCRTYDCRVFTATGAQRDELPLIARQSRRWRFNVETDLDRVRHAAVRAAATYLREHRHQFGDDVVPSNPTQLAVLAVEIHDVFLPIDGETGPAAAVASPPPGVVAAAVLRRRSRE